MDKRAEQWTEGANLPRKEAYREQQADGKEANREFG